MVDLRNYPAHRPTRKFRKDLFQMKLHRRDGRKFGESGGKCASLKIFKGFGSFALQKNASIVYHSHTTHYIAPQ